jgi:excisionase family DNA binding protein
MTAQPTSRIETAIRELVDALRDELQADAPAPDRLLDVEEAAAALGIGRTRAYVEMDAGRLESVRIGRRRLVPASAIARRIRSGHEENGRGSAVSAST